MVMQDTVGTMTFFRYDSKTVTMAEAVASLKARVQLVAAANPWIAGRLVSLLRLLSSLTIKLLGF